MIHHVFACKSNIGDWLSGLGIQKSLQPHEVIEHYCDEPFIGSTVNKLSTLAAEDIIVVGGGGLFMDYFDPFWRGLLPIMARVRTFIWGAGLCDLKTSGGSRGDRTLLDHVVASSALCVVRDRITMEYLKGGVTGPIPCPSLIALDGHKPPGHGLLHVSHWSAVGQEIWQKMDAHARSFASHTGRHMAEVNNQIKDGDRGALNRMLDAYRGSDLILTSRLHGCIIGVGLGKKVLAVSGDWKIESFMEAAGLSEWVCPPSATDQIPEMLERLPQQPLTKNFVANVLEANTMIARRIISAAALDVAV